MRSGKDGEYYFVTLDEDDDLDKLKELVLKKIKKYKSSGKDVDND